MHPIVLLTLLTLALLVLSALRLELNFRRAEQAGAGAAPQGAGSELRDPEPGPRARRPELRASPAGGYWQAPFSRSA